MVILITENDTLDESASIPLQGLTRFLQQLGKGGLKLMIKLLSKKVSLKYPNINTKDPWYELLEKVGVWWMSYYVTTNLAG